MATTQTIYSQLTNLLRGENVSGETAAENPQVLKANSAEERSELVLQTQQQRYFNSQLLQLMQADTYRRVYVETTRRQEYLEYEAMEEYPDIARALDLLAEEATMGSIKGRSLNIYSDNERVKTVLSDLFYKELDIPTLLFFWARNMIKHGDCFLYLNLAAGAGITGARLLSTFDTERHETVTGENSQAFFRHHLRTGSIQEYNIWQVAHFRMLGNERRMPYGTSVLFRVRRTYKMLMMAKDAVLIYRLTRAPERRVHKIYTGNINPADVPAYLQAVADNHKKAPLVNPRTGDINFEFQPATMDMDYFVGVSSETSGTQIDTLPGACLALDTRIPLLDGRTLALEEIIAEHEAGKKLWVYSINPATGRVVPGPITWAGVTRRDAAVLKITLDNGEEIITTPDHKFPTRTGAIKEAQNLKVGESLFSFTRVHKQINASENAYEMVYDHEKQKYLYTHRLVARAVPRKELVFDQAFANAKKGTIHHADFNRWNNTPENLVFMNSLDHIRLHQATVTNTALGAWKLKYHADETFKKTVNDRLTNIRNAYYAGRTDEQRINHTRNLRDGILNYFKDLSGEAKVLHRKRCAQNIKTGPKALQDRLRSDPEFRAAYGKKVSDGLKALHATQAWKDKPKNNKYTYSQELIQIVVDHARSGHTNQKKLAELLAQEGGEFMILFRRLNVDNKLFAKNFKGFGENIFKRMLALYGYAGLRGLHEKLPMYNHRIVSIEYLAGKQDTGTITVDGPEQYHNFHNFALEAGVFTQNSNLDALGDLRMLEDDLYGGLGIPKSFIKFNSESGGSAGDGKSFAMLDLRLARLVSRIQQALLGELNRLALIHLYLLGDDFHEELTNFTLTMNSPSVQLELMHEELRGSQLDNYVKATTPSGEGVAPMSAAQAMKDILGMSEAEVKQNFKDQFYESKIYAEIKAAPDLLPSSGLYDDILRFAQAGQPKKDTTGAAPGGEPGGDFPPGGGGGFPGGGAPGGGADPFPGDAPAGEAGGAGGAPPGAGPGPGTLTEQTRRAGARLLEMAQLLAADPTL